MNLSKQTLLENKIQAKPFLETPSPTVLEYPEKVLQFGTGILLRGLPDYFIDKANKQGIFQGRILVVKSTQGSAAEFEAQDGLYTLTIRGLENGKTIEEYTINASISRVLSANDAWQSILATAASPQMQVVISNTTEVGIQYVEESTYQNPPNSFPAKLTAWLHERFNKLGDEAPEVVIIPTELIQENGKKLYDIVLKLAQFNELSTEFLTWLQQKTIFCNSLVDRIVTGNPDASTAKAIEETLGYEDKLLTITEPYKLWAIEGCKKLKNILSFETTDKNLIITPNIEPYINRKLRILNGSHTIAVYKGYLNGFETILECMQDAEMSAFIEQVIHTEIVPTLNYDDTEEIKEYAHEILDRFRNPFLHHLLLNITMQSTSKMRARNIPTIFRYYKQYKEVPIKMLEGFAAYLRFMQAKYVEDGKYYGEHQGKKYLINDEAAPYFYHLWQRTDPNNEVSLQMFTTEVCSNTTLWGLDLSNMDNFEKIVLGFLQKYFE